MIILINGIGSKKGEDYRGHPYIGALFSPRAGNSPDPIARSGILWACDNDCFTGFDEKRYLRMLEKMPSELGRCLFVTAPDVVGCAWSTLELFEKWYSVLWAHRFPVALVAQDGLTIPMVPWNLIDCLFIGGSTHFKLGPDAEALTYEALRRNKWVHMGRVNSRVRFRHAYWMGCHSVDGSAFSWYSKVYIPQGVRWLAELDSEKVMRLLM